MKFPAFRFAAPSDAIQLAHIQVTSWRSAFRGIAPDEYLDDQVSVENQTEDWREILGDNDQIVIVAEMEKEVTGYCWAHQEEDPSIEWEAELISMHILPQYRRQGIGRGLVSTLAAEFRKRDWHSMYLWVLEDNHAARAFYESLGGTPAGKHQIQLGGKDLIEVAYGWKDIRIVGEPSFSLKTIVSQM